jgi:hypothetical protein
MLQKILLSLCFCAYLLTSFAQTTNETQITEDSVATKQQSFTISGWADFYYRYDISKNAENSMTSFTHSQNSFELGMASLRYDHSFGNVSLTGDFGFGKRAEEFAYTDVNSRFIIKQLYLSYALKNGLKFTAGSWATHVGYELVDAPLNRNYSMSYMFSYGPFFHTGVKAEKTFGKVGAMLGIANPTDLKSASFSHKFLIGQLSAGGSKLKTYLNFQAGRPSDDVRIAQADLVATYAITDKFSLGTNATIMNVGSRTSESEFGRGDNWWGAALYLNVDPKPWMGLTLRTEYFNDQKQLNVFASQTEGGSIIANTLSLSFKKDNLIFIPEIRLEKASTDLFLDKKGQGTDAALNFLMACMYKF